MSIRTTKPALDEEADLRQHVEHFPVAARELPELSVDERIDVVERIATFIAEVLLPHATFEQRVLYPQAARLLREPDESADVADDRAQVRELLGRLVEADASDAGALQEALFALYTVLSAHFWREEAVLVKLASLPDEAAVWHAVSASVAAHT